VAHPELTVLFASSGWLDAVVREVNAHADLGRALSGLGADLAAVIERDPRHFPSGAAAWGRQEGGRIVDWRILPDQDDVLELEPAYVVRAPLALWKDLLTGRADPVQAALSGRVQVKGDLEGLVRRAAYRYIVDQALRRVPTEFPDEVSG
jgi:hypothetical protein